MEEIRYHSIGQCCITGQRHDIGVHVQEKAYALRHGAVLVVNAMNPDDIGHWGNYA